MKNNNYYLQNPKQLSRDITHKSEYITRFNNYISFCQKTLSYEFGNISISNRHASMNALNKVIRILALNIQDGIISHVLNSEYDYHFTPMIIDNSFSCPKCDKINNYDLNYSSPLSHIPFDLGKHPAISSCWNISRLISAFGNIGQFVNRPFEFKELNHFSSVLVMPINLLIIGNGYHSSTSGIYDTNAIYYPEYILDISDWYSEIHFNGIAFFHTPCGSLLASPEYKEIGTIYEIGRLLLKNDLNLIDLHAPENSRRQSEPE